MFEGVNALDLLIAAGVLLANYWLHRLNGKFDRLTGRVDELGSDLRMHVNATGLHN